MVKFHARGSESGPSKPTPTMPTTLHLPASGLAPLPVSPQVSAQAGGCTATLLVGAQHFEALHAQWQAAVERMARPSVFLAPDFVETAWRCLHHDREEAWFVVLREADQLVGLLPLVAESTRYLGLPVRRLYHMGLLAGDRPGIVTTLDPDLAWRLALQTLLEVRSRWQLLDLQEIDEGAWPLSPAGQALCRAAGVRTEIHPATWAGTLPIQGRWEDYFQARSGPTRQSFRRAERQLEKACPDLRIEVIDDAAGIDAACTRYLAIEARSWKARAGVELWSDPRKQVFLREMLVTLARRGSASVWLLRGHGRDIAGLVRLRQGPVMFERHWAYDPDFHKYSPGTYLRMMAVRQLFGSDCVESDALGMDEPLAQRRALASWYPVERRTYRLQGLNLPAYHEGLYRLSRLVKGARDAWRKRHAAPAPAVPNPDAATAD